jgi:hypothetical protein
MTKRRKGEAKAGGRGRRTKRPVAKPRTFKKVVAYNLQDPFHAACLARLASGERFDDPTREVSIYPDREGAAIGRTAQSAAGRRKMSQLILKRAPIGPERRGSCVMPHFARIFFLAFASAAVSCSSELAQKEAEREEMGR